jgi:WD40 repeat protein
VQDLRVWDVATGKERLSLKNPGYFSRGRIAISPDGKLIAWAGQQDAASLWDANTGQMLRRLSDIVRGVHAVYPAALTFSPDSRTLAVGQQSDRTIQLLDTTTGTEQRRLQLPSSPGTEGNRPTTFDLTADLAFSPDGKTLAALQRAGKTSEEVFLWDVATGRELRHSTLAPWPYFALRFAFSPDGTTLAFGCTPGPVRLWDSATFRPLREFPSGRDHAPCVSFSPDGRDVGGWRKQYRPPMGYPHGPRKALRSWPCRRA